MTTALEYGCHDYTLAELSAIYNIRTYAQCNEAGFSIFFLFFFLNSNLNVPPDPRNLIAHIKC